MTQEIKMRLSEWQPSMGDKFIPSHDPLSNPQTVCDPSGTGFTFVNERGESMGTETTWYLHSRATRATPPVDLTAIREPFGLLDAATQEALKAHGGPYEYFTYDGHWMECQPAWGMSVLYRVKPVPPAPSVETVTHDWNTAYGFHGHDGADDPKTTHRITFDLIDGEPDCASVRMVKL